MALLENIEGEQRAPPPPPCSGTAAMEKDGALRESPAFHVSHHQTPQHSTECS